MAGSQSPREAILGLWDGHDAGAALIADGVLVAAVNEERLSRRKLDVRFPAKAIECCLRLGGVDAASLGIVAASTTDLSKTLTRYAPSLKEEYYRVRRRLGAPGALAPLTRAAKYRLTQIGSTAITRALSRRVVGRELARIGIRTADVRLYDHHYCHATAAAMTSGFPDAVVLTIDGLGDGLSSTVSRYDGGSIARLAATPASHSLGVFFEHVTNLLNMRELEDEGKVMALADHAAPVADADNPMLDLVRVEGLETRLPFRGRALARRLRQLFWRSPPETFARMAQTAIERVVGALAREACRRTGLRRVALAGGVAANVKANRRIRLLDEVDDVYVFPHMGDGGLAIGAALAALGELRAGARQPLPRIDVSSLALGPGFTESECERALRAKGITFDRPPDPSRAVAALLQAHRVVFWVQGRMEVGPRALGGRSVLARPDSRRVSQRLNLALKRRVWYQPFCPSILEADARRAFDDWKGSPNRHMTMTYHVRAEMQDALAGVMSVDDTCRPQIVGEDEAGAFPDLLHAMRQAIGIGAVLNTSLNLHGEPMVCSPAEAVDTYLRSGADALCLGPFLAARTVSA